LDGDIRNIPMSLLYDRKASEGNEYMIDKGYSTTVTPRLDLFISYEENQNGVLKPRKLNVLVGGNDFSDVSKNKDKWPRIDDLKTELNNVAKVSGSPSPLLNQEFTKENIVRLIKTGDYSAIHFKTHGEYSSDPEKNFLVTYNGDKIRGKDLSSLISAGSKNGANPLDLIVLSACKSAQGDNRSVLGLAGIAAKTGARSVLSAAWTVDDKITTEFMTNFYKQLLVPGTTKAQAVMKTQKLMKDSESAPAPHEWAAYSLIGSWI
jgi:CHAT domain-containing protein